MKRFAVPSLLAAVAFGAGILLGPGASRAQDRFARPRQPLRWEYVSGTPAISRARVPGGWLVTVEQATTRGPFQTGIAFYPDPEHRWDGGSID